MDINNLKNIKIQPAYLKGSIRATTSKSIAHRALICAALANEQSNIYGINESNDIMATIGALKAMGFDFEIMPDKIITKKTNGVEIKEKLTINCGESASTLRFLIPVAAYLGIPAVFTGEGRLPSRPVTEYKNLFADKGVNAELCGDMLPLTLSGKLTSGKFYIAGNITSQFITGLMFVLPLLDGDSEIILTSPLESAPYVDITIDILRLFGINIQKTATGYYISGNQSYMSATVLVEGDFSQAAFFAAAAAINGDISIKHLNPFTSQGDYKIVDLLCKFGARVYFDGNILKAKKDSLRGIEIDAKNIPDIIPILSVVAAYANGTTRIYNAGRLRIKESDRLHSIYDLITSIGGDIEEYEDSLVITGKEKLRGGFVKTYGDHRIAMSAVIAAIGTEEGVTIDDLSCIRKSYPQFYTDFLSLI